MSQQVTGPTGTDGLPLWRGTGAVVNRIFRKKSRLLWIGDSIGSALMQGAMRTWWNPIAGQFSAGGNMTDIGSPSWVGSIGGLGLSSAGNTGLLPELNYSICNTREATFNGSTIPVLGSPAALAARLASDSGQPAWQPNTYSFGGSGGSNWVNGRALNCRSIYYTRGNGENGFFRNYVRGSSASAERGTGTFVNLNSVSPGYLTDDFAVNLVGTEDFVAESQGVEGQAPTNGRVWACIGNLITCPSATSGIDYVNISQGGWNAGTFLDTSLIAASAWLGILPLLAPTEAVIMLTQNGSMTTANYLALKAQLRAALPNVKILWAPTHDTYRQSRDGATPSTESKLINCQQMYAAADFTEDDWINLHGSAGTEAQLTSMGATSDGVHPTTLGDSHLASAMQGLAFDLIRGAGLPAVGDVRLSTVFGFDQTGTMDRTVTITITPSSSSARTLITTAITGETPTSMVLSDAGATYGVKRNDTGVAVVAAYSGGAVGLMVPGVNANEWVYYFDNPAPGLSYTISIKFTWSDGSVTYGSSVATVAASPGVDQCNVNIRCLTVNGGPRFGAVVTFRPHNAGAAGTALPGSWIASPATGTDGVATCQVPVGVDYEFQLDGGRAEQYTATVAGGTVNAPFALMGHRQG